MSLLERRCLVRFGFVVGGSASCSCRSASSVDEYAAIMSSSSGMLPLSVADFLFLVAVLFLVERVENELAAALRDEPMTSERFTIV